jgi:hypothetical protein
MPKSPNLSAPSPPPFIFFYVNPHQITITPPHVTDFGFHHSESDFFLSSVVPALYPMPSVAFHHMWQSTV